MLHGWFDQVPNGVSSGKECCQNSLHPGFTRVYRLCSMRSGEPGKPSRPNLRCSERKGRQRSQDQWKA